MRGGVGLALTPTAIDLVLGTTGQRRTPEPLRCARHLARTARDAADVG